VTDKPDNSEERHSPEGHEREPESAPSAGSEEGAAGARESTSASSFDESFEPGGEVTQDDLDALFAAGGESPDSTVKGGSSDASGNGPEFFDPGELDQSALSGIDPNRVTMLSDVKLRVKMQLGRTRMLVEDVLKLSNGSVVELDRLAGDPVDVLVNDRLIARGEVLVLNDNFCVRISEVLTHDPHRVME